MDTSECINESRIDNLYKFLSLSSDTPQRERIDIKYSEELLANISVPNEFTFSINAVGKFTGTVDAAEYILLSWKDFNGGLFSFTNREIISLTCLSRNLIKMQTRNGVDLIDNKSKVSIMEAEVYFLPESNLLLNVTSQFPDAFDTTTAYFDPRLLCETAILRCPGGLYPYADLQQCYDTLNALPQSCIPEESGEGGFSTDDGINGFFQGDTVACRYLHLNSAALRPTVHCEHMASISAKCTVDQCPNTVRDEIIFLSPTRGSSGNLPIWLCWVEGILIILFLLFAFASRIWYKRQHYSLQSNRSTGEMSPMTNYNNKKLLPKLEVENLKFTWSKSFGGEIIYKRKYLSIGGERLTAFTAPSGTGKSSFMKILAGFKLNHMELTLDSMKQPTPMILHCDQSSAMWPREMIVKDILLFSCTLLGSKIGDFLECFNILGIGNLFNQQFGMLSGGQQQLVHIASVIVAPCPTLIFLDEPIASLDESKAVLLLHQLKALSNQYGHSFLMTVHICSDKIKAEFDDIIAIGFQESSRRLLLPSRKDDDSLSDNFDEEANDDQEQSSILMKPGSIKLRKPRMIIDRTNSNNTLMRGNSENLQYIDDEFPEIKESDAEEEEEIDTFTRSSSFQNEIKALFILWHAQFSGRPIIEIGLLISGIIGGSLIGSLGRGPLVDHNLGFIPTNETIRSMFYIAASLLGLAIASSFGVSHVFWTRENELIQNFNSQGILRSSSYITVSLIRGSFLGFLLSIPWITILIQIVEGGSNNLVQLFIHFYIFSTTWIFTCTFICGLLPTAYSAHGILYLDCIGLLFSGILVGWEYIYPFFRYFHYANPVFLFSSLCSYLFLEDLDAKCNTRLLHVGECASGLRAYEINGLPKISPLIAQGVAILYIVLSSIGISYKILKGRESIRKE